MFVFFLFQTFQIGFEFSFLTETSCLSIFVWLNTFRMLTKTGVRIFRCCQRFFHLKISRKSIEFLVDVEKLTSVTEDFLLMIAPSFRTERTKRREKKRSRQSRFFVSLPLILFARAIFFRRWNSFLAIRSFFAFWRLENWSSFGSEDEEKNIAFDFQSDKPELTGTSMSHGFESSLAFLKPYRRPHSFLVSSQTNLLFFCFTMPLLWANFCHLLNGFGLGNWNKKRKFNEHCLNRRSTTHRFFSWDDRFWLR